MIQNTILIKNFNFMMLKKEIFSKVFHHLYLNFYIEIVVFVYNTFIVNYPIFQFKKLILNKKERRSIELKYGANYVVYTDNNKEINHKDSLFLDNIYIGTLEDIRNNPKQIGTTKIFNCITNECLGDVDKLKYRLTAESN